MGYFETLKEEILKRSVPSTDISNLSLSTILSPLGITFIQARNQWEVDMKWKSDYPKKCLCGYPNIIYLNRLKNCKTGETVIVGSCCVKQFEFKDLGICCMECNKSLPMTNRFVESLLNNGVILTEDTNIIGHEKCCKTILKQMGLLYYDGNCSDKAFSYRARLVVEYFEGIIRSIWDTPAGIEINYKEQYEDYLILVIGKYLLIS
jgi:hypothetical protein